MIPAPALVTMHVWGVRPGRLPGALVRMARDRFLLRGVPGLRFAKLLGTGSGTTFSPRDADLGHWALLTVWDDSDAARDFAGSRTVSGWDALSFERLDVSLRPLTSRGRWSRQAPFGDPVPSRHDGPVASLTRARLTLRTTRRFRRAVPAVAADLTRSPGLRLALAIGESPVGLQGTFSLWESTQALLDFASRRSAHQDVVARTPAEGWYAEELFARFAVLDVSGTYRGTTP